MIEIALIQGPKILVGSLSAGAGSALRRADSAPALGSLDPRLLPMVIIEGTHREHRRNAAPGNNGPPRELELEQGKWLRDVL